MKHEQKMKNCKGLDCLYDAEKEVLMAMAKAYADLHKATRGFEQAGIADIAKQISMIETIETFKKQAGYDEWTIEEFLKLLDIHLD